MGPKKDTKKDTKGGKGKGKEPKDTTDADDKGKGKGLKAANSINVRHILCEKHSKKEEALEKLRNGAKFDDVAREFSEDKARQGASIFPTTSNQPLSGHISNLHLFVWGYFTGGSLGWKVRGSLHGDFEKVAYDLEPSTTANPKYAEVKTGFGYHIIMVEGRK
ncbi:hypothetical protein ZTR_00259 [Talaromyces verruculosus]|nr:hypothetical protein ZTR_00259 [Talaromyces verruculosus]